MQQMQTAADRTLLVPSAAEFLCNYEIYIAAQVFINGCLPEVTGIDSAVRAYNPAAIAKNKPLITEPNITIASTMANILTMPGRFDELM